MHEAVLQSSAKSAPYLRQHHVPFSLICDPLFAEPNRVHQLSRVEARSQYPIMSCFSIALMQNPSEGPPPHLKTIQYSRMGFRLNGNPTAMRFHAAPKSKGLLAAAAATMPAQQHCCLSLGRLGQSSSPITSQQQMSGAPRSSADRSSQGCTRPAVY